MKYHTYVAAGLIALCSAATAADDRNPAATTPGETQTTGQAASQGSGDEQSTYDQANSEDQANHANSAASQQSPAPDEQQPRLVVVVPEEMQDQMEDLIAFIQSSPNAEIVVVSQEDQDDADQNQDQDSFMFPESEAE